MLQTRGPANNFESKISKHDEKSDSFVTFLYDSKNEHSLDEIISNQDLIPDTDELNDPISWAARTSLPPI